jgi:site-specific DNA-methyltransferase (adenine-specific)
VFEPIRAYLVAERDAAGITNRQVDEFLGTSGMSGHYFGASQWALPTAEVYAKLQVLFNADASNPEHLRREYEDLRRPFNSSKALPYTDVWNHRTVNAAATDGKHPAQKPLTIMADIVDLSSRRGDTVLDPFAGSGTTLRAAKDLGRKAIGIEIDERYCEIAAKRLGQEVLDFGAL